MAHAMNCVLHCSAADSPEKPSSYIRQNASEYIIWVDDEPKVKLSILECKNDMVKHEAEEIRYNVPELFVE